MASLIARSLVNASRRGVQVTSVRFSSKGMMADPMEHATGLEKRELLAQAAGNDNPFDMRVYKRVAGDKSKPLVVTSFYDRRIVGCVCEEDATCVNWMWMEKGETKRCECGYWFQLAEAKPVI